MLLNLRESRTLLCLTLPDLSARGPDTVSLPLILDAAPGGAPAASLLPELRRSPLLMALPRNAIETGQTAATIATLHPEGVILTDARGIRDVQFLDMALRVIEAENGWPDRSLAIVAGFGAAPEVFVGGGDFATASPRLAALAFDEDALAVRLGLDAATRAEMPLPISHARAQTILMAAHARLPAFQTLPRVLQTRPDIERHATAALRDGFSGMIARTVAQASALCRMDQERGRMISNTSPASQ